jgi:hypothetical protein
MKTTHFAAVDLRTRAIHGVGRTEADTRQNAVASHQCTPEEAERLTIIPMSEEAYSYVVDYGGSPCRELKIDPVDKLVSLASEED